MTRICLSEIDNRIWTKKAKKPEHFRWNYTKTSSRREEQCRQILESIFQKPFPSIRPSWLVNPVTGNRLELDGYNAELAISFEYQGEQHYKFNAHYHNNNYIKFLEQQRRDQFKSKKCQELGIHLISIPYYIDDLNSFIRTDIQAFIASRSTSF